MSADISVEVICAEDVRQVLIDIVAADPDHVDPRTPCEVRPRYISDGVPNCLVGNVLSALGFDADVLTELDAEFPIGELLSSGIRIGESENPALARIDEVAMALLTYLQDGQDAGLSWIDIFHAAFAKPSRLIPTKYVRERRPWLL